MTIHLNYYRHSLKPNIFQLFYNNLNYYEKSAILGLVAALFVGHSAMAQSNQEISYVEDPSQGYLFNSFSNNWFVSVEGGMNYYLRNHNSERSFLDRFSQCRHLGW